MTVFVASVDLFLPTYRSQIHNTKRNNKKIDLAGFSLGHLEMVVTIVTIISLTLVSIFYEYNVYI